MVHFNLDKHLNVYSHMFICFDRHCLYLPTVQWQITNNTGKKTWQTQKNVSHETQ